MIGRGLLAAAGALVACASLPAGAPAAPTVSLRAALRPEIPGHASTVLLQMRVAPERGRPVPPPMIAARLRYPAGLEVTLSGLGIEACAPATLSLLGPTGCPPDSRMGYGHAVAEAQIEGEVVRETARIAIVRAAEREGHVAMLIVVYHEPAVSQQIILPTVLLGADGPFGGRLAIRAPLIGTFPEGPDLSVTRIDLVLGPKHLRYTERRHGRITHYEPAGIPLPERCPRGGFPFTLQMSFLGGATAAAATSVPCPAGGRSAPRRRPAIRRRRGRAHRARPRLNPGALNVPRLGDPR